MTEPDWEQRVAALWATLDDYEESEVGGAAFCAAVETVVSELDDSDEQRAVGDFERACAQDSTGHSDRAVPLYAAALERGLTGIRRRRAVIQMSSSLRNLGQAQEGVQRLRDELDEAPDELDDAVRAVLALCLVDVGRAREATSVAVGALAGHLPRYQRSMARYARLLVEPDPEAEPEPG